MFRKIGVLFVISGLLALLAACAPAAVPTATPIARPPTAAPAKTAEPAKPTPAPSTPRAASIKMGAVPSSNLAALYLTVEKGYFKEQGIAAEIVPLQTPQETIAPLGTGQLDVGVHSLSSALLAAADRGIDLKIVAAMSESAPNGENNWIMLRKDLKDSGQVKTVADLKGMKIAILSKGGLADQTVQLMLERGGLKPGEVETVVLPPTDYAAAFANKSIAAGHSVEPFNAIALQQDVAVKWLPVSSFYGGRVLVGVMVFGVTLAKDQDLGRRWMLAYVKGIRDYLKTTSTKEGWDDLVQAVSKNTRMDPKLADLIEMGYLDPNGLMDKKSIDIQYKWFVDNGLYTGKKTFDDITDLSYIEYAMQRLGKQ